MSKSLPPKRVRNYSFADMMGSWQHFTYFNISVRNKSPIRLWCKRNNDDLMPVIDGWMNCLIWLRSYGWPSSFGVNSLPAELHTPDILLNTFRKKLKTFLFNAGLSGRNLIFQLPFILWYIQTIVVFSVSLHVVDFVFTALLCKFCSLPPETSPFVYSFVNIFFQMPVSLVWFLCRYACFDGQFLRTHRLRVDVL